MAARGVYAALAPFKKAADAGTTLDSFEKYVKRAEMVFATEDIAADSKKKAFLQLWGGDAMMTLFEHEGKVAAADTYEQAVTKIKNALKGQINEVYPVFKLFCEMPQGKKSFTEWYPSVLDQAKLCNFEGYNAQRAARDAMTMQTANHKLRKQALADGLEYQDFIKYGLAIEASSNQADSIEKADVAVSRIQTGRDGRQSGRDRGGGKYARQLASSDGRTRQDQRPEKKSLCDFCGYEPRKAHTQGRCPAKGKKCNACNKKHHFSRAKVCPVRQVEQDGSSPDSEGEFDDVAGRVHVVNRVPTSDDNGERAMVEVHMNDVPFKLRVDSGCKKVLIPEKEFDSIKHTTRLIRSKVRLRPYGIEQCLEVKGRAKVTIRASKGMTFDTYAYVVKGHQVEALLGLEAGEALGILQIHPEGQTVTPEGEAVNHVDDNTSTRSDVDIPQDTKAIVDKYPSLFEGIGKFANNEINFDIDESVKPVVQRERPIPFAYRDRLAAHLKELKKYDVIEGPLDPSTPIEYSHHREERKRANPNERRYETC